MKGFSYKTTAVALQNRRLVILSKKRGVWRAAATDAGAHYLERGNFPPTRKLQVPPERTELKGIPESNP